MAASEQKRDLRVQKTYDALIAAMAEMMAEQPFEKISVKALCERARVRTATFYAHFADKYDFFAFMVKEYRRTSFDTRHVAELAGRDFYLAIIRSSLEFLERYQAFVQAVMSNDMLDMIVHTSGGDFEDILIARLEQDQAEGHRLIASPEIAACMFVGGLSETARRWLAMPGRPSVEEMMGEFDAFVDRIRG